MTLRLSDEQTARLRERAAAEGRSMHEVTLVAIDRYLDGSERTEAIGEALADVLARYPETLRRLGE